MTTKTPIKLMGRKRGMMQVFDKTGRVIPCTVIEVEPNIVTALRTQEKDGYSAIQLGFEAIQVKDQRTVQKRLTKPLLKQFEKSGVSPRKVLQEARVENPENYTIGQEITIGEFKEIEYIDARAVSIGKGFAGAMKRYHFKGMRASHGVSAVHRSMGSTGNRSTPGRCFKGKKFPGHMGAKPVTQQNLKVIEINEKENCLIVRGAVPGPKNGLVTIQPSVKKQQKVAA